MWKKFKTWIHRVFKIKVTHEPTPWPKDDTEREKMSQDYIKNKNKSK